jgi:serine/threonine protein kinase
MLFLHDNGIFHCDLSPDSILFHKDGDHMYIDVCDWGFACRVDSPRTSKYNYGMVEEMNKVKVKQLWVDPTLFTTYGQEKVKYSLGSKLFTVTKIAIQIMGHDPEDCGMSRSDFEIYSVGMRTIFHASIENRPQTLKSKIDTIQNIIGMLGTNPVECY